MLRLYETARDELQYNATYFKRMLAEYGGLEAAHRLLRPGSPSEGFTTLWERQRLDLTVEAHVLDPEFEHLFSDEELATARSRLADHGYVVPND